MNRRVLPLFLLLLGWFALGFWLCKKYLCNATPTQTVSQSSMAPVDNWTIADGTDYNTSSPDYFRFERSGANHLSLGSGLESAVASTAAYLKENPNRSLDITGYYMDGEENNSILPTLGLARANNIKELFVNAGVAASQLNLMDAKLPFINWSDDNNVNRGIALNFSDLAVGGNRLEEIKARLVGKPLTLYFKTNQSRIGLSTQQRKDFADIMYYLDRVESSNLSINGHTDSDGERDTNLILSERRASFVKEYLKNNGNISLKKMDAKGFGPDQPVASNDSDDGKAQNRRVEVILN